RYPVLLADKGKAGDFFRKNFAALFAYSSMRVPEISDEFYKLDDAMRAGYGWAHGPFEIWNAIGVKEGLKLIDNEGLKAGKWVNEMLKNGKDAFYTVKDGKT